MTIPLSQIYGEQPKCVRCGCDEIDRLVDKWYDFVCENCEEDYDNGDI